MIRIVWIMGLGCCRFPSWIRVQRDRGSSGWGWERGLLSATSGFQRRALWGHATRGGRTGDYWNRRTARGVRWVGSVRRSTRRDLSRGFVRLRRSSEVQSAIGAWDFTNSWSNSHSLGCSVIAGMSRGRPSRNPSDASSGTRTTRIYHDRRGIPWVLSRITPLSLARSSSPRKTWMPTENAQSVALLQLNERMVSYWEESCRLVNTNSFI